MNVSQLTATQLNNKFSDRGAVPWMWFQSVKICWLRSDLHNRIFAILIFGLRIHVVGKNGWNSSLLLLANLKTSLWKFLYCCEFIGRWDFHIKKLIIKEWYFLQISVYWSMGGALSEIFSIWDRHSDEWCHEWDIACQFAYLIQRWYHAWKLC